MKWNLIAISLCLITATSCFSQESGEEPKNDQVNGHKHELGIRAAYNNGRIMPSLQYRFLLNKRRQLDFSLYMGLGHAPGTTVFYTGASAFHNWKWNITNGLEWFVGPGLTFDYARTPDISNSLRAGLAAQIGMQYDFNQHHVPLILGMDMRPTYKFSTNGNLFDLEGGIFMRFTF